MKILDKKTAYIFKENNGGHYTVILSHPYFRYQDHKIDKYGLPILYMDKKTTIQEFHECFSDYKLFFRKPQMKTMKSLQWTLFISLYENECPRMKLEKSNNELWHTAVDIYWHLKFIKLGIYDVKTITNYNLTLDEISKMDKMTHIQIYDLLVIKENDISLN